MVQLKMFSGGDPNSVIEEANRWMTEHNFRVCQVTQSQSEKQGRFVFVLTLAYEAVLP